MKVCKNCRQFNADTANFCIYCGTALNKESNKGRNKKIIISAVSIFLIVLIVSVALFLKFGIHKPSTYRNISLAEEYITQKYPDDEFEFVNYHGDYDNYDLLGPITGNANHYVCEFTSDKTGDDRTYVCIEKNGEIICDNYWKYKYKDEITELFENAMDSYFGQNNYVYEKESLFTYANDYGKTDLGAQGYAKSIAFNYIYVIVNSDFNAYDEKQIENDIRNNMEAFFDDSAIVYTKIFFDRNDDLAIPDEFDSDYTKSDCWEKSLYIHKSLSNPLECEWEENSIYNPEIKTTSPFLNGKTPEIMIDGYVFTLGSTTPKDIMKNTKYSSMPNSWQYRQEVLPDDIFEFVELCKKGSSSPAIDIEAKNTSSNKQNGLNCEIYQIGIESTERTVDNFKDISIDGLFIGDTVNEEILVQHFGIYETTSDLDGCTTYRFIDGTAPIYDNMSHSPDKYLDITLNENNVFIKFEYQNKTE